MNIVGAWKRGYTGKNVVVTILDDGIERNHPDLMQNYVSQQSDCKKVLCLLIVINRAVDEVDVDLQ